MTTRDQDITKNRPVMVIDPALHTCELDCFNAIQANAPFGTRFAYFAPALFGPTDLLNVSQPPRGIIILGSGASVHDRSDWQSALQHWLKPMLEMGVPTLGICYGHQLLAHLFGGEVILGFEGEKKRGSRKITLHSDHRFANVRLTGTAIVSHRELVSNSGKLSIIGSSDEVSTEVLEHPDLPIWGFQAHIEATPAFVRNNDIPLDAPSYDYSFGQNLVSHFLHTHLIAHN